MTHVPIPFRQGGKSEKAKRILDKFQTWMTKPFIHSHHNNYLDLSTLTGPKWNNSEEKRFAVERYPRVGKKIGNKNNRQRIVNKPSLKEEEEKNGWR